MDRFFSVFGKVIFIILILGGVSLGSFYFGKKGDKPEGKTEKPEVSISVSSPTSSPSPTGVPKRRIEGGVPKSAGLSYYQFFLNVPSDWIERREKQTPDMDEKLLLEKDGYQLSIFQGATGGAACLYVNDPDFEGPSSTFTTYEDLTLGDGLIFRRSGTDTVGKNGKIAFSVCQKSKSGDYGQPTNYGHIYYSLPNNYDVNILSEMDEIVSSLTKI